MTLEEVIGSAIDLPLGKETNVSKVAMRGDRVCFLTDCEASSCKRLASLERREEQALGVIEGIGNRMVDGKAKDELRKAYRLLRGLE